MTRKSFYIIAVAILITGAVTLTFNPFAHLFRWYSINDRVAKYEPDVSAKLWMFFGLTGVEYPPNKITLIAFKDKRSLEVYVAGKNRVFHQLCSYDIKAASGQLGPKLRQGDGQVPEGIYRIESLNPNSLYHLSLRLDYPNEYDRMRAKEDGRTKLGGDIMIHGKSMSAGCLAMGDPAIEDLFVLCARTGIENVEVIIAPSDFRKTGVIKPPTGTPAWTKDLYSKIDSELKKF
jgi:hypothetical protein